MNTRPLLPSTLAALAAMIMPALCNAQQTAAEWYALNEVGTPEGPALRSELGGFEGGCASISGSPIKARSVHSAGYNVHIADGRVLYLFYPGATLLGRPLYRVEAEFGESDSFTGSVLLQSRAQFEAFAQAFGRTAEWDRRDLAAAPDSRWFPDANRIAAQDGRVVAEFRSPDERRAVGLYEAIDADGSAWVAVFRCSPADE